MKMQAVDSSNIDAVGYDAETETLHVKFRSGDIWEYDRVPEREYDRFMAAPSLGKYFNKDIRGAFDGRKL